MKFKGNRNRSRGGHRSRPRPVVSQQFMDAVNRLPPMLLTARSTRPGKDDITAPLVLSPYIAAAGG